MDINKKRQAYRETDIERYTDTEKRDCRSREPEIEDRERETDKR